MELTIEQALQQGVTAHREGKLQDADNYGLRAGVNLAICNFLEGDFEDSKAHLLAAAQIQEKILKI